MRGPRFTAQMPNPQIAQPDAAAPCACQSRGGLGFAVPDMISEWPWQTVLLVLVAAWLVYRELIAPDNRAPRRK